MGKSVFSIHISALLQNEGDITNVFLYLKFTAIPLPILMSLATQCARENSFGASKRSPVTSFTILYFIWSYLLLLPLPPEKIFFLVIHPQPHTHKCVHVQSHIHIHTHAMLHSTVRERQFS